jgi:hypothetical protein
MNTPAPRKLRLKLANGRTKIFDNFVDLFGWVEDRMLMRGEL